MKKSYAIALCLLLAANWAGATTYYIDYGSGNDTNAGTSTSAPWQYCPGMVGSSSAYSHAAGDVFIFKGGVTWPAATLPLTIANSGAAGAVDTYTVDSNWFDGASFSYPVLDGDMSLGAYNAGIYATGKSYFMIDNLKIIDVGDTATGSGKAIEVYNGSCIEIKNCWLQPEGIEAFAYDVAGMNASNIVFHHNQIHRAGRAVIYADTGAVLDDVKIYNNVFEGAGDTELGAYHIDGFMIGNPLTAECTTGGVATVKNVQFYNNYFYGDWSEVATAQLYSNGCTDGLLAYNNVFSFDNTNVVGGDICLSPGFLVLHQKDKNVQIYNNTFANDAYPGYGKGASTAINISDALDDGDMVIKNNIFSGLGNVIAYDSVTNMAIDYNLYNEAEPGTGRLIWNSGTGGWEAKTIADCQTHDMETNAPALDDPEFVAIPDGTAGSGDWHLQSSSPAIGIAKVLTNFTTDISGVIRSSLWDMGAYEYAAPAPRHLLPIKRR